MEIKVVKYLNSEKSVEGKEHSLWEAREYELDNGMEKGEVLVVQFSDKLKLYICCPGCGAASFTGSHQISINNEKYTANPSLVFQCCGWHGWLKDNILTSC